MEAALDRELALAYRRGQEDNWMLNYFQFPESPYFLDYAEHQLVSQAALALTDILAQASDDLLAGRIDLDGQDPFSWLDIPGHCAYWIRKFYQPGASLFWGRPDFHLRDGKPYLLESNLASAAGYQQQVAGLCQYYQDHPHWMDPFEEHRFSMLDPMVPMKCRFAEMVKPGDTVLIPDIYESYRHKDPQLKPYGGMVSWFNLNSEFKFRSSFIHDVSFRSDGVYLGKERIQHVFMSYYNPHVFDRFDEFLPFWDLYQKGKINILDSMNEVLWSNKLLLAFLSEFIDDMGFNPAQRDLFKEAVPWTRMIRPGKTKYSTDLVDLERFVSREKDRLVMKKAQSAEGKQVFVGKFVPQDAWDTTLQQALVNRQWIVQEFIEPGEETLLVPKNDDFTECRASVTVSPYLAGKSVAGYLTRYYRLGEDEALTNSASVTRLNLVGTVAISTPQVQ